MFLQSQRTQEELEQVKASTAAEVRAVQAQVAAEAQVIQGQASIEKERLSHRERQVEAERRRTSEIQQEIERQVVAKQREAASKEQDTEKKVAQLIADFEAISSNAQAQLEAERAAINAKSFAEVEREKQKRIAAESEILAMRKEVEQLRSQLQSQPEVFRMDAGDILDTRMIRSSQQQVQRDHELAMSMAEEVQQQAAQGNWFIRGSVAETPDASVPQSKESEQASGAALFGSVAETGQSRPRKSVGSETGAELQAQLALQQEMMSKLLVKVEAMSGDVNKLKQASARSSPNRSEKGSAHSSDSEYHLSITSSLKEELQRGGDGGSSGGASQIQALTQAPRRNNKELDKVEGIPAYPTVSEFAGWKRETRYAVAAASVNPRKVLHHVLKAERWSGTILDFPSDPEFETLEVKFGKALKAVCEEMSRERLPILRRKC